MIQIDIDIPKDCNGCPFAVTGNGEYFFCCFDVEKEVDMDSDYRRKDCPLKEVSQEPTDKIFTKADIDAIVKAINKGWELRINEVLDKIRAEIDNALSDGMIHKKTVLGIIDKYRSESEEI